MADAATSAPDKKIVYGEDSTDSDNDEKKGLLRRISTSKCVGRLVSNPFVYALNVGERRACQLEPPGWGDHVPGQN